MARHLYLLFLILAAFAVLSSEAFAPVASMTQSSRSINQLSTTQVESFVDPSSSIELSAATLDPTTLLSDVLGGLIGGPAILAVPILAALGLASLIAFFIVSYANPEVEDDEY
jgi:hypothetical protein